MLVYQFTQTSHNYIHDIISNIISTLNTHFVQCFGVGKRGGVSHSLSRLDQSIANRVGSMCLRSRLDLIELTVPIAESWIFCIVIMHSVALILSRVDASGSFRIEMIVSGINRNNSLDGASPAVWNARKISCRSLCELSTMTPIRPCERVMRVF